VFVHPARNVARNRAAIEWHKGFSLLCSRISRGNELITTIHGELSSGLRSTVFPLTCFYHWVQGAPLLRDLFS
jgi:hypothetical protein